MAKKTGTIVGGNIVSPKERKYYGFVIFPFRVIYLLFMLPFYLFMISVVIVLPFGILAGETLESFYEELERGLFGLSEIINISSELIIPAIFIVWLMLIISYELIMLPPTRRLRKKIEVGTKMKIGLEKHYKKYHETGTTTTYYYYGMKGATYKNYITTKHVDYYTLSTTVTKVKRNGFEINASDIKTFIKYKDLYKNKWLYIKGLSHILSIDIIDNSQNCGGKLIKTSNPNKNVRELTEQQWKDIIKRHTMGLEERIKPMTPGGRLRAIVAVQNAIEKETGHSAEEVFKKYEKYADKSVQIKTAMKD